MKDTEWERIRRCRGGLVKKWLDEKWMIAKRTERLDDMKCYKGAIEVLNLAGYLYVRDREGKHILYGEQ